MRRSLANDYERYWEPVRRVEMLESMPLGREYTLKELRLLREEIIALNRCRQSWDSESFTLEQLANIIGTSHSGRAFFSRFKNTVIIEERLRSNLLVNGENFKLFHMLFGPFIVDVSMKSNPYKLVMRWRRWIRKM